jgi:hypothetical protein
MNKLKSIIVAGLLLLSSNIYADQLQLVSKIQADKAVQFIKQNKVSSVILWCSCCSNEPIRHITIEKFYARYSGTENYYEMILEGKDENGNYIKEDIDLAYVFLRSGNQAKCFGQLLKFECDPCTLPFEWNTK